MNQHLDKNNIRDSVQKAKPQDLLYLTVNSTEKYSKKYALTEIDKFISKGIFEITLIRK